MPAKVFDVIVACCDKLGIGCVGDLPWKLKKDMQFFRRLTITSAEGKQNAVIMGRKTYFSIPEKFRPLKNRINVVLSRGDSLELPEFVYHAKNFDSALALLSSDKLSNLVDKVFIIGGATVYHEALTSPNLHRIYLTRIYKSFNCDVFLPKVVLPHLKRIQVNDIPSDIQQENGMDFEFEIYQRVEFPNSTISMCAAMCSNFGIGLNQGSPWPSIPTDYKYYTTLTGAVNCKPGALVANVRGRLTYEASFSRELDRTGIINIVISSDPLRVPDVPPHLVVPNLEAALRLCKENANIESVWIMGGSIVCKSALSIPECSKLYLTEIEKEFDADCFFPQFKHLFTRVSEGKTITENGVSYRFNVYERKSFNHDSEEETSSEGGLTNEIL